MKTIIERGDIRREEIVNEIGLMKMCGDDSGILDLYETYQIENRYFMVVEIMDYPLNSVVCEFKGRLEEEVCKYIILKSLQGLVQLHSMSNTFIRWTLGRLSTETSNLTISLSRKTAP